MPPKQQNTKGSKKDASKKPMKPKESGGGKAKKKKWSKGKVRDKLNNMVLFDKPTFDKLIKDVPQIKMISPSVVSERLKIRTSLARRALEELCNRDMALNVNTALETNRLILVPYLSEYVEKYHNWMSDLGLRESTSSDLLTLDEEIDAQKKWISSNDRITFILLSRQIYTKAKSKNWNRINCGDIQLDIEAEREAMIGDVNFFLSPHFDQVGIDKNGDLFEGELSVMIAEPKVRGHGLAGEAVAAILEYIGHNLNFKLESIYAKVTSTNQSSIRLFEKRLGFVERERNSIFNEIVYTPSDMVDRKSNFALNVSKFIIDKLQSVSNPLNGKEWFYREYDLFEWRTKSI